MRRSQIVLAIVAGLALVASGATVALRADGQTPPGARAGAPAPDRTKPQKLGITTGTRARYKVTEQLAGISFPSEAVGTTESITGAFVVNPDGSFAQDSKITVDLKTLSSDQSLRDNYIQTRTLETDKFQFLEIVPKRTDGLAAPLPAGAQAQAGFQLVTDMTLHGVTKETIWNVVAVFGNTSVGGRATTTVTFADFKMTKPSLARLLSVDDKIQLEIEFRCTREGM